MTSPKLHFRDLIAWQRAMSLASSAYALANSLPSWERFALADQTRRAAVSIPASIAEGQARRHAREFHQFLAITKGSLAELETLVLLCEQLGYVSSPELQPLLTQMQSTAMPLNGLLRSIHDSIGRQPATSNRRRPTRQVAISLQKT